MDWHDYLEQVTKYIPDNSEAAEVRQELWTHLTVLKEELMAGGMDEPSADSEALRRMGAVEDTSQQFKALHNPSKPQRVADLYEREMLWNRGKLSFVSLLKVELKRALSKWQVGLAFLLILAFFIQGYESFQQYRYWTPVYNAYMAFMTAFDGPSALLIGVFPLLVSMASGDSLAWDRKTGFIEYVLTRTTVRKYILSKIVSASVMSFTLVFSAEVVAFAIAWFTFPTAWTHQLVQGGTPHNLSWLYVQNPIRYVALMALVAAFAAMVFAIMSVVISTNVTNIYLVLAGPWLFYMVSSFVFQQVNLLRPFAPLTLLGQYVMVGGVGPEYVLVIPFIWVTVWLFGSGVVYLAFTQRLRQKGVAT